MIQSLIILFKLFIFWFFSVTMLHANVTLLSPIDSITYTSQSSIIFKGKIENIDSLRINNIDISNNLPYFYISMPLDSKNRTNTFDLIGFKDNIKLYETQRAVIRPSIKIKQHPVHVSTSSIKAPHSILPYQRSIVDVYNKSGWVYDSLTQLKDSAQTILTSNLNSYATIFDPLFSAVFSVRNKESLLLFFPVLDNDSDLVTLSRSIKQFLDNIPDSQSKTTPTSIIWYNKKLDLLEVKYRQSRSSLYFNNNQISYGTFKQSIQPQFTASPIIY